MKRITLTVTEEEASAVVHALRMTRDPRIQGFYSDIAMRLLARTGAGGEAMSQFITNDRTVGIFPDRWKAERELEYQRTYGMNDIWTWRIDERNGAFWVVASYVPPDEPLLER